MATISRTKRHTLQGFTLVELLVVMGIIAILVAVTSPALNSALVRARTAKCSSNLRNIGAGMIQFAGDNNGSLPLSGGVVAYGSTDPTTGLNGWTQQLESYLGSGSAKEDPSGNSIYQCPDRGLVKGNVYYSYFNGAHAAYAQSGGFGAVNLMRMHSPSMHIIAGDISSANMFSVDDDDKDDYTQDPGFQGYTGSGTSPIGIHGGMVNMVFADGHVESLRSFDSTKMTTVYDGPGSAYNYLYPH